MYNCTLHNDLRDVTNVTKNTIHIISSVLKMLLTENFQNKHIQQKEWKSGVIFKFLLMSEKQIFVFKISNSHVIRTETL